MSRAFTCGQCGSTTDEHDSTIDEYGNRVLKCGDCGALLRKTKVYLARPLPAHLQKMPEARFNKRPI